MRVGTVQRIWRYPVKSVRGELLAAAEFGPQGMVGDRRFAVRDADGKLGSGKSNRSCRRFDGLLAMTARYDPDGVAALTLPDGRTVRLDEEQVDDELRAALGRDGVRLAVEGDWPTPQSPRPFYDGAPVHLLTTASLGWLAGAVPGAVIDERRMRPNLVLRTGQRPELPEDAWVGRTLLVGERVRLYVDGRTQRCAMVNSAQSELPYSGEILKTLGARNELDLGVNAEVATGGTVRLGDPVLLG
jgi:uncharacterized protein YcbX